MCKVLWLAYLMGLFGNGTPPPRLYWHMIMCQSCREAYSTGRLSLGDQSTAEISNQAQEGQRE